MADTGDLVVKFSADLSNLTSGIDNAKSQINSVGNATEEAAAKVAASSSEIEGSMAGVAESADRTSGGFLSSIGHMGGSLLDFGAKVGQTIFGLQSLWQMGTSLAQGLLGPAISAETVTTALTTLDGSAKAAGVEMQALNAFAAKTPFKTLDIDQAAQQLQGFGFKAKEVVPTITAIGDALGSVGRDTPAELDSVVQIFGKIRTEGKVTQMTMNELAVHGINGWQALADATGKTIPQVKEMVKQGLLPADTAIADLTTGIEKNPLYKGGMAKAAATFTGLLSTLQSNFAQVLASFGSPIITALEGQLNNLGNLFASPGFQSFAGSVGKGIVLAFQGIGSAVGNVIGYFKSFDLGGITYAFKNLGDVVGGIVGPFMTLGSNKAVGGFFTTLRNDLSQGIVAGITTVRNAIDGLSQMLTSLASNSAVKGFLGALGSGFQQVSSIVGGQLQANFKMFLGIAQDLGKWWQTTMAPAIAAAMPGFLKLGSVIASTLVPAIAKIWAVGQQVTRDVLPYFISAFKTLAPIVVQIGGFIADNLGKAIQFLTPYIVSAAQAIGQFASDIASRVAPIIQNLWNGIMTGINIIMPVWKAMWPTISAVLKGAWDIIVGIIKVAWALVSGIIKIGLDILSGNWKKVWDDVKSMFSGVWDGMKTIVKGVWDGIWGIIKGGINFVIGLINDFIGGLDSLHIDVGPVHVGVNIPKIPLLASGGFVPPGGMAIAGEAGPELIMGGPGGATVLSNSASRGALGGGTPIVQVFIDGREIADHAMVHVVSMMRSPGHPVGSF